MWFNRKSGGESDLRPDTGRDYMFSLAPEDNRPSNQPEDGTEPGMSRRSAWFGLGTVAAALVMAAGVVLMAIGVSLPKPPPDTPEDVMLTWWGAAFTRAQGWDSQVCRGHDHENDVVVAAEYGRQKKQWPPKDWYVRLEEIPLFHIRASGTHATVTWKSDTIFWPSDSDGFTAYSAYDQTWTATLTHPFTWRGRRWCIDQVTRRYLPGYDPNGPTMPRYYAGGLVGPSTRHDLSDESDPVPGPTYSVPAGDRIPDGSGVEGKAHGSG